LNASQIRTLRGSETPSPAQCWALWREDLPCPNVPMWRIQNTTNAGYSLVCDVHKEGFATAYPHARVVYAPLATPQEASPPTPTPGQLAYEAWFQAAGLAQIVPWAQLRPDGHRAWDAAALAVLAWEDVRQKHQEGHHA